MVRTGEPIPATRQGSSHRSERGNCWQPTPVPRFDVECDAKLLPPLNPQTCLTCRHEYLVVVKMPLVCLAIVGQQVRMHIQQGST